MKLTSNTINKIHVFHLFKTTVETLTKIEAVLPHPNPLYWINGILFNLEEIESEELIIKKIHGIWYIDSLTYAFCKEHITESSWNGYAVEVIDLTGHPTLEKLIELLRSKNETK